jgi:hypothetical protein
VRIIAVPPGLKEELRSIAAVGAFRQALEILERGNEDELAIADDDEAQCVVNVARWKMLEALLRYPNWDDTREAYDPDDEEAMQEVQMGLFEKVVLYVGQEFKIRSEV